MLHGGLATGSLGASNLNKITFASATVGFIVGDGGVIITTTNGGSQWSSQTSGTTLSLADVSFISATEGVAVGFGGTILVTSNGGVTWSYDSSGATTDLYGVAWSSSTVKMAVGAQGTVISQGLTRPPTSAPTAAPTVPTIAPTASNANSSGAYPPLSDCQMTRVCLRLYHSCPGNNIFSSGRDFNTFYGLL